MADILKVTSPVIGKNIVQQNKNVTDPSIPFDLQEISHIARNPNSSALLSQHNIFQRDAGAATLMNLLKDPDVTVNYLKNITMLEEIISLLPVNNNTVTEEIQQLFQALLIHPDSIVDEMMRQEYSSTLFKGPLFDFLRSLVKESGTLAGQIALVEEIGQTAVCQVLAAYFLRIACILNAGAFRKLIHIVVRLVILLQHEGRRNRTYRFALDLTCTETVSDLRSRIVCTAAAICGFPTDP